MLKSILTKCAVAVVETKIGHKYVIEVNGSDVLITSSMNPDCIHIYDKNTKVETISLESSINEGCFDYNNGVVKGVINITRTNSDKPFNLDEAMNGVPVRTKNGKNVQILTFNMHRGDENLIVALVSSPESKNENVQLYYHDGRLVSNIANENLRLVMVD